MSHNIIVESGKAFRLLTSGKYCDRDIIITAEGGKEDLDVVLTEQDNLIDELREVLKSKGSGEAEPVIEPLEVTENGTYNAPAGVDGYSPVAVNVPVPDGYIIPSGSKSITENGTHDVAEFAAVEVNVEAGGGSGDGDYVFSGVMARSLTGSGTIPAEKLGQYALYNLSCDGDLYLPNATELDRQACEKLSAKGFYAPKVTTVGYRGFYYSNCERIELPECQTLGGQDTFLASPNVSVNKLEVVILPKLGFTDGNCFKGQDKLHTVDLRSLTVVGSSAFSSCSALKLLDFPNVEKIYAYAFSGASALKAVLLRKDSVCTLSAATAFNSTPIASGTGYIYVPRALLASYQGDSVWSTYAAQFRALEDYTVDGTITGELDETKI